MRLRIKDVEDRVRVILHYAERNDHEAAHGEEDRLHTDILQEAARGVNVKRLAEIALGAQQITFRRDCA